MQNYMYQNPILKGDFSDPDVIRVNDDYYMVTSSFTYFPGIPLLHSRDLVHWRIINHVAAQIPFPAYEHTMHKRGLWAPSLRYQDGTYYVYVCMPDEGLLQFKTTDPYGDWECSYVKNVCGWIDPCPLWDEDGNAYLVHAVAKSRLGYNSRLYVHKMTADGLKILDSGVMVFDGEDENPTTEGPKFYKRNGFYYILCPAGGVKTGWQLALRSRNPFGPYECKRVMQQGGTSVNGPHQGAYIEGNEENQGWFLHFQDVDAYGRITHLQPVQWVDEWPHMGKCNPATGIGEPMETVCVPYATTKEFTDTELIEYNRLLYGYVNLPDISDTFASTVLAKFWQWQAAPKKAWYSLTINPGYLRLYSQPGEITNTLFHAPWFLSHSLESFKTQITVRIDMHCEDDGDRAGIAMMGYTYSYLSLTKCEGQFILQLVEGQAADGTQGKPENAIEKILQRHFISGKDVTLRMTISESKVSYSYKDENQPYKKVGEPQIMSPGGWTGARAGIFCGNFNAVKTEGYTDFSDYRVEDII